MLLPRRCLALLLAGPLFFSAAARATEEEEEEAAAAAMASVLAKQPAIGGFSSLSCSLGGRTLSVQVPAAWTAGPLSTGEEGGYSFTSWGGLVDPVLGTISTEVTVRTRAAPDGVSSVADYGPQSQLLPVSLWALESCVPGLGRADITRASARRGTTTLTVRDLERPAAPDEQPSAEALFYEWELAVPPDSCAYNTGCNSAAVYFLSATVCQGTLCLLTLKLVDEAAYRASAGALRAVRASFTAALEAPGGGGLDALLNSPPLGASQADPGVIVAAP